METVEDIEAELVSTQAEPPAAEGELASTQDESPLTETELPSTEAESPYIEAELPSPEVEGSFTEFDPWVSTAPVALGWAELPVILLEEIYAMLSLNDRRNCSRVCWNWNEVFDYPQVWRQFTLREGTFTYKRYNLFDYAGKYSAYEYYFSPKKCQGFLARVAKHIRHLKVDALEDFHSLGEFMCVLSSFLGFYMEYPMPCLETFHFTLSCETSLPGWDEPVVTGTGGNILANIKSVIGQIQDTHSLTLNQLLLMSTDSDTLLTGYLEKNRETARYLELVNCTKTRYPLIQVAMFPNLVKLVITPHNVNADVLEMLLDFTELEELVLVQDKYTPPLEELDSVTGYVWLEVKLMKPHMRVRLEANNRYKGQLLIQVNAPVNEVVTTSLYPLIDHATVLNIVDNYRAHLRVFAHLGLPKRFGSRKFQERGDTSYVMLAKECPNLQTLVIRERVSTATVMIVAREAKQLKQFLVRRNAVLMKSDWPRPDFWPEEEYTQLVKACKSIDSTEQLVSSYLNQDWVFLLDRQFKEFIC